MVGLGEAFVPNFAVPGFTLYTDPIFTIVPVTLSGPMSVPGQGTFDLDVTGALPTLVGLRLFHQFAVLDPNGPGGVSFSNGLEVVYGF